MHSCTLLYKITMFQTALSHFVFQVLIIILWSLVHKYIPINMENAAENPNSDEEDIEDEIRKLKAKLQEAIKKKEARKRKKQKIAIRNELLKQIAELEAGDTDIADSGINLQVPGADSQLVSPTDSTINLQVPGVASQLGSPTDSTINLQVPGMASQLGSPADSSISNLQVPGVPSQLGSTHQSLSIPELEGTPQIGQVPLQRTIPQPHVALQGVAEHGANSGEQGESYGVCSEPGMNMSPHLSFVSSSPHPSIIPVLPQIKAEQIDAPVDSSYLRSPQLKPRSTFQVSIEGTYIPVMAHALNTKVLG